MAELVFVVREAAERGHVARCGQSIVADADRVYAIGENVREAVRWHDDDGAKGIVSEQFGRDELFAA